VDQVTVRYSTQTATAATITVPNVTVGHEKLTGCLMNRTAAQIT